MEQKIEKHLLGTNKLYTLLALPKSSSNLT